MKVEYTKLNLLRVQKHWQTITFFGKFVNEYSYASVHNIYLSSHRQTHQDREKDTRAYLSNTFCWNKYEKKNEKVRMKREKK